MRIYHLIKSLGRGGAEMLLPEGIRCETSAPHTHRIGYFLPWKDALVPSLHEVGASVHCFDARDNARILAKLPAVVADIRRWKPDVLHCHLPVAGAVGRVAGRLADVPVVYTEHNLQERYHPVTARLNAMTWGLQRRAIACSGDVARSIHEHIGHGVEVRTVLNGVSLEQFRPTPSAAVRERLGIPADAPVGGTVAVFRTQKRLVEWVAMARTVVDQLPDAHFLLVGDGPLRADVHAAVAHHGLQERVHLPGLLEDVRPFLSAMDVYIMSSKFEGLPVALLEAMAMGIPAVCTRVGGIGEVIRDGEDGWTVDPDDLEGLAERVTEVLSDREAAAGLGRNARARVGEAFGMDRMMGEIHGVYREAMNVR